MVFHNLSQAERGVYFEQVSFVLDGVTDPAALAAAWQHVVTTPVCAAEWRPIPGGARHITVPITHLTGHRRREPGRAAGPAIAPKESISIAHR